METKYNDRLFNFNVCLIVLILFSIYIYIKKTYSHCLQICLNIYEPNVVMSNITFATFELIFVWTYYFNVIKIIASVVLDF